MTLENDTEMLVTRILARLERAVLLGNYTDASLYTSALMSIASKRFTASEIWDDLNERI